MHRESEDFILNYNAAIGGKEFEEALLARINKELKGNQNNQIHKDEVKRERMNHVQKIIKEIKEERESVGTLARSLIPERKNKELQKPVISMPSHQKLEGRDNFLKLKSMKSRSSIGNPFKQNLRLSLQVFKTTGNNLEDEDRKKTAMNLVTAAQNHLKHIKNTKAKGSPAIKIREVEDEEKKNKKIFTYEELFQNRDELEIEENILEKFFRVPRLLQNVLKKKKKFRQMTVNRRRNQTLAPNQTSNEVLKLQEALEEKNQLMNLADFSAIPLVKSESAPLSSRNMIKFNAFDKQTSLFTSEKPGSVNALEKQSSIQTPLNLSPVKSTEEIQAERALSRRVWSRKGKIATKSDSIPEADEENLVIRDKQSESDINKRVMTISEFDVEKVIRPSSSIEEFTLNKNSMASPSLFGKHLAYSHDLSDKVQNIRKGQINLKQKEQNNEYVAKDPTMTKSWMQNSHGNSTVSQSNTPMAGSLNNNVDIVKVESFKQKDKRNSLIKLKEKNKATVELKKKVDGYKTNPKKAQLKLETSGEFISPILKSVQGYVTKKSFSNFRFGYLAFHSQNYHKLPLKFRKREQLQEDESNQKDDSKLKIKHEIPVNEVDEIETELEQIKRSRNNKPSPFQNLLKKNLLSSRNQFYDKILFRKTQEGNIKEIKLEEPTTGNMKKEINFFVKTLDDICAPSRTPGSEFDRDLRCHNLQLKHELKQINNKVKSFEDSMLANFFHPERLHNENT